jgi:hypothetical protein
MSFNQQVILILVDKLIIGLLLAITAYLASRALESYKKRQALAGEIAKQRVQKIAEVWEHLSEWDFLIEELLRRLARVVITQHPDDYEHLTDGTQQRKISITSSAQVYNAMEVLDAILSKHRYMRIADFGSDWETHITPILNEIDAKSKVVGNIIRKNEFWLGLKLTSSCRAFEKGVDDIRGAFDGMDLGLIKIFFHNLEDLRKNVLTILKEIE